MKERDTVDHWQGSAIFDLMPLDFMNRRNLDPLISIPKL